MRAQVLVGIHQSSVRVTAVTGPNVQQIVSAAGEMHFKLLGQGLGRRPMPSTRIRGEKQNFQRTAVLNER